MLPGFGSSVVSLAHTFGFSLIPLLPEDPNRVTSEGPEVGGREAPSERSGERPPSVPYHLILCHSVSRPVPTSLSSPRSDRRDEPQARDGGNGSGEGRNR